MQGTPNSVLELLVRKEGNGLNGGPPHAKVVKRLAEDLIEARALIVAQRVAAAAREDVYKETAAWLKRTLEEHTKLKAELAVFQEQTKPLFTPRERVERALGLLKQARILLRKAESAAAGDYVARAMKSAEGALRHKINLETRGSAEPRMEA